MFDEASPSEQDLLYIALAGNMYLEGNLALALANIIFT